MTTRALEPVRPAAADISAAVEALPQVRDYLARHPGDGVVRLRVDDEGPGLPEPAESLFQPFVRGVRESATSGAGLGLALCRLIVEAHGGTIATENRQEGGARFVVALPVKTAVPEEIE